MNASYKIVSVKTWYLLFTSIIPDKDGRFTIEHWKNPPVEEYLSLYKRVGEKWGWSGRLLLTADELQQILSDKAIEVWLFKSDRILLGFFEIDRSAKGKAEIVYLGLLPEMIGRGYGKAFLNSAITTASGPNNDQVWLHTCEYDHPFALEIYKKAGFVIENETIEQEYYPVTFNSK